MRRSLISIFLSSCVLLGACSAESFSDAEPRVETARTPVAQATEEPPHSELSNVVAEALPSVVNVKVKSVSLSENAPPLEGAGEGSGVVIDEEGIILTNYHVVAGAVSVRVVFTDDREPLTGTVIGGDRERDLAVIRVEADDLDAIPVGNSERLRLGDTVIAIGFPLGLGGPTVTSGILSGTDRRIQAQASFGVETLVGLLQTDAAINPGNSGGALVDLNGRLVGINTAVAGSAENIGFAIAIDEALPIVNEILTDPPEEQAWLGVQLGDVTSPALARELGLPADTEGAVVFGLIPGSPAEEAGLEEGEVVVSVDGEEITSSGQLIEMLRGLSPGTEVTLEVLSPDGTRTVTTELAQRPVTFEAPTPTPDE
jgi:S1-C subfamily serine protease